MARVNQLVIDEIKRSEGLRLEAYPDPGSKDGKPVTIGYGTTRINGKPISLGTKITKQQAEAYLQKDIENFAEQVSALIKVPLNEYQFGALVSLAYNIGINAFKGSTLLRKLNAGDYAAVPNEFRKWKYNDGKIMQGLINRREREIELWSKGITVVVVPQEPTEKPAEETKESKAVGGTIALILVILGAIVAFLFGGAD